MNNYVFLHKYSGAVLTVPENSYEEVLNDITGVLKHPADWICQNEEGEDV